MSNFSKSVRQTAATPSTSRVVRRSRSGLYKSVEIDLPTLAKLLDWIGDSRCLYGSSWRTIYWDPWYRDAYEQAAALFRGAVSR